MAAIATQLGSSMLLGKRKQADSGLGPSILSRPAKAQRSYYGIDIHGLLQEAQSQETIEKVQTTKEIPSPSIPYKTQLWTEKYRPQRFFDLIGDERTHRTVMHWLKKWDETVFPGIKSRKKPGQDEVAVHRKIMILTGAPGLGKTTLAHVCAKQAGYEVQEVNASDERSRDVVKGRIRDMVGTENVKNITNSDSKRNKIAKPVCVVVDEVDGVVGGSGSGGEGGFVKALIDLVMLDQKNSSPLQTLSQAPANRKKGDRFRLRRPLILVCNDIYHPSLRPLRQSNLAEIIHVRKPQLPLIATRVHSIFEKEGMPADLDGVRRLCEAVWGVSNRREDKRAAGAGEGDMRSIMVVGEWIAAKVRNMQDSSFRLTRRFVEDHLLPDLQKSLRGSGRGGSKEIVERVFSEGAGFPKSLATHDVTATNVASTATAVKGVAESSKKVAMHRLRELLDTHGDSDRILSDVWTSYPMHPFQDDTLLGKPDAAYDWLHFHDSLASAVYTSNEWELAPYMSTPVLAFHHLFASQTRSWSSKEVQNEDEHPFLGTTSAWAAAEAAKVNTTILQTVQSSLTLPLTRLFPAPNQIATELIPYALQMLNPSVNPVIVGGSNNRDKTIASVRKASEQELVARAVNAMTATGTRFERMKVAQEAEHGSNQNPGHVYRMEPALDSLCSFETAGKNFGQANGSKTRYAVRQVLDQEFQKEEARRNEAARAARFKSGLDGEVFEIPVVRIGDEKQVKKVKVVKDFFGRTVAVRQDSVNDDANKLKQPVASGKVWITYHEGFSNAVRKPVTLSELMKEL